MEIQYEEIPEFARDFKKLLKKFKTLNDDFKTARRDAIELLHIKKIDNQSSFPIPNFCSDQVQVYKLKKFACKSLKGRGNKSGIRIIYAFFPGSSKIIFIEIYFKGSQSNEDQKRIKEYIKAL